MIPGLDNFLNPTGGGVSGSSASTAAGHLDNRSPVYVAPTATNLGSLLNEMLGPSQNGGTISELQSPNARRVVDASGVHLENSPGIPVAVIVGGVAIIGVIVVMLIRK